MPFPQDGRWAIFHGTGQLVDSGVPVFRAPRTISSSVGLEREDHEQMVISDAENAIELTLQSGFKAGFRTTLVQAGEGVVNVVAGDGVTLEPEELGTAGKGSICLILAIADDSFLFGGDTGPAAPLGEGGTAPSPGPTAPPVNRDIPHLQGAGTVGSELQVTMGNWDNEPDTYSYQWKSDGTNIAAAGTSSNTYTVDPADLGHSITCVVTATNSLGSTEAPPSNGVVAIT